MFRRDDRRDDRRGNRDRRDDRRDDPDDRRDPRRNDRDFERRPDDDRDRERRTERREDSREGRREERRGDDMDTSADRQKDDRFEERRQDRDRENRKGKVEAVVPLEGIEWEVIEADIQLYLGPGATVKVEIHPKNKRPCYWCTGYSTLTEAMLSDLKADSARWEKEKQYSPTPNLAYKSSSTHHGRQQQGPTRKLPVPAVAAPRPRAPRTQSPEPLLTYAEAEQMIAKALKDKGARGVNKAQLERLIQEALTKDREQKTGQEDEQPRAANQGKLVAQAPPKYPPPDPGNPDRPGPYGGRR